MSRRLVISSALAVVLLAGAGFAALAWHPRIAAAAVPDPGNFEPALVRRGATLAALGNCAGCHSAPGRPAFSGGLPVETPFGAIYASNLTPDAETGIGRWSEAAFRRGVAAGTAAVLTPATSLVALAAGWPVRALPLE